MRCCPVSPGAVTSAPTNHDSGAGQYSVIVTDESHLPRACLPGGGGSLWMGAWVGARPPMGAPPVGSGPPPDASAPAALSASTAIAPAPATKRATVRSAGGTTRTHLSAWIAPGVRGGALARRAGPVR